MQHKIYNEQTGISYTLQGDYYLPDLALPCEVVKHIGILGQRHARCLKKHHKVRYINLLTSGKLNSYLADIDAQVEELFFRLVKQLAEKDNVTEKLKAEDTMRWVQKMNNIRNSVMEFVNTQLINV